jgi:hypothetical protein
MSMMACSYCGDYADTDDGEGAWDVRRINSNRKYDFVCGCCVDKYLTEDGQLDPDLDEAYRGCDLVQEEACSTS